jgi:segment polarity protein dishevelled
MNVFLNKIYQCFVFLPGLRINGHSKHRSGHGYESSSMLSSDLETTSFLESEDDASSRITTTTGRATNLSVDRQTLGTGMKLVMGIIWGNSMRP